MQNVIPVMDAFNVNGNISLTFGLSAFITLIYALFFAFELITSKPWLKPAPMKHKYEKVLDEGKIQKYDRYSFARGRIQRKI